MRNLFEHRRGFCLASLYTLFALTVRYIPQAARLPILLGLSLPLAVFAVFPLFRRTKIFKNSLILFLVAAFSFVPTLVYDAGAARAEEYVDKSVPVRITVIDVSGVSEDTSSAFGILEKIGRQKTHVKVKLTCPLDTLSSGDILSGYALVEYSENSYLLSQGYRYELTLSDAEALGSKETPTVWAVKARERLCALMSRYVSGETGNLLCALFLGERENVSDGFITDMNRLGTSHMLALSGMHFSILLLSLERLFMRVGVDKRYRYALCAVLTVLYLLLTGFPPSAVRAGIMLLFVFVCFFLKKDYDGISALAFSVALICTVQPYSLLDGSLWLSAFATFGILLILERGERNLVHIERPSLVRTCVGALATSVKFTLAASFATLPLTAIMFGKFPLLFVFANLLFAPLMNFLLVGAIIVLLFGWIPVVSLAVSFVAEITVFLSSLMASLPNAQITLNHPFVFTSFLLFALLLFFYVGFCPKKAFSRRVPIVFILCFSLLIGGFYGTRRLISTETLSVTYAATSGKSADYFILKEGGQSVVVDVTAAAESHFAEIDTTLFSLYECEIDAYVFTSYPKALQDTVKPLFETYTLHRVYLPMPKTRAEREILACVKAFAKERRVSVFLYDLGETLSLEDIKLTLHHRSTLDDTEKRNYFSVSYGKHTFAYISSGMLTPLNNERIHREVENIDLVFFGAYGTKNDIRFGSLSRFTRAHAYAADKSLLPFAKIEGARVTDSYTFRWKK